MIELRAPKYVFIADSHVKRYLLISDAMNVKTVHISVVDPNRWVVDIIFANGFRVAENLASSDISPQALATEIKKHIERMRPSVAGKYDNTIESIADIVSNIMSGSNSKSRNWTQELRRSSFQLLLEQYDCRKFTYESVVDAIKEHYSASDMPPKMDGRSIT